MKATWWTALSGFLVCLQTVGAGYDFEGLTQNHFLNGHDNWVDQPGQGDAYIGYGEGYNTSLVVRHLRTVIFDQSAYLTRVNDEFYRFIPIQPNQRNLILQFDVNGEALAQFGLGCDVNGDGMARTYEGEIGPVFGTFDRSFQMQEANQGTATSVAFAAVGRSGNSGSDWYRIQFFMDFAANDGEGAGSLRYANLSDGYSQPVAIPQLQDINLGLGRMTNAAPPSAWNALWVHVRSSGSNVPAVDHLMVIHPPALEIDRTGDGMHVVTWPNPPAPLRYRLLRAEDVSHGFAPILNHIERPEPFISYTGVTSHAGFYRVEVE